MLQSRSGMAGIATRRSVACSASGKVPVRFVVQKRVKYGEIFKVVGNQSAIGNWGVGTAPEMRWSEGHVWEADVELPKDTEVRRVFSSCRAGVMMLKVFSGRMGYSMLSVDMQPMISCRVSVCSRRLRNAARGTRVAAPLER